MNSPEEIAKGLTKAQREAVIASSSKGIVWEKPRYRALRQKGLMFERMRTLTPLGLAVRQHIMEQSTESER